MSNPSKSCRLLVVALAAACLFVFQLLAGSVALGAGAASPTVDAFGNPLCITHVDSKDTGALPGRKDAAIPDCCTVACSIVLLAAPFLAASATLFNPLVQASGRVFDGRLFHLHNPPDYLPGHPRAPPASA